MKKFTRTYRLFILCFLLFGVSLFLWNCEGDYELEKETSSNKISLKNISYKKVPSIIIDSLSKIKNNFARRGEEGYIIDTTSVTYISKDNYNSYTFNVVNTEDSKLIENIVISTNNYQEMSYYLGIY